MQVPLVESGRQSHLVFLLAPKRSVTSFWFLLTFLFVMLVSSRILLSARITGPCPFLVRFRDVGTSVKKPEFVILVFLVGGVPLVNLLLASLIWLPLLEIWRQRLQAGVQLLANRLCSKQVHSGSDELQDRKAVDVVERRLISKDIWRVRRKERRKSAVETVASAVESRRAPGPFLSGSSNRLNWSKVFGRVIADFFAEIFELRGEELATEDAARATHVKHWLDLDPVEKRVRRNYGDAVAHHSTHNTQHHTRTYQHQQLAHKQSNAPQNQLRTSRSMEDGGDGVFVAPVSRMTGYTSHRFRAVGTDSLERTCQRRPRKAGPNRRGGLSRHSQVWSTLGSASSASRVRAVQEPSPSCICRSPSRTLGVSASGDGALVIRAVGQGAHGVLNVYADALALDIKAPSPEAILNLKILKMSDEIPSRSVTIKAASTAMKERISKDAFFDAKSKNGFR